jgi:hypothetical protein
MRRRRKKWCSLATKNVVVKVKMLWGDVQKRWVKMQTGSNPVYDALAVKNFPGENQCLFEINLVRRQVPSCVVRGDGVLDLVGSAQGCLRGGDGVLLRPNFDARENDDKDRGERGKNLNKLAPFDLTSLRFLDDAGDALTRHEASSSSGQAESG